MRISDWSSDVCSSDLITLVGKTTADVPDMLMQTEDFLDDQDDGGMLQIGRTGEISRYRAIEGGHLYQAVAQAISAGMQDRKSVVSGKSVSVRVALGGRRIIQTNKTESSI